MVTSLFRLNDHKPNELKFIFNICLYMLPHPEEALYQNTHQQLRKFQFRILIDA